MIKELLYKWFGLDGECKSCETLRSELDYARRQNEVLLDKLINPKKESETTAPVNETGDLKPITSGGRRFIPQAVRHQIMEREDLKTLELLQKSKKNIEESVKELEKEVLGKEQDDASKIG